MNPILEVKGLKKHFKTPGGMLHAVDGVSFSIQKGTTLGVVGESGCGKSTLGRTIMHLLESTDGDIVFDGKLATSMDKQNLKAFRKNVQMIFQDPFSSLNPRMTIQDIISEPIRTHKYYSHKNEIEEKVASLMGRVGIADRLSGAYPHELDGGRRQRVGIARALALDPQLIICDEPVSALDVSIQAQVLNLMQDLQEELDLTYIFITHDLSVVRHISDQILVMYLGKMVELTTSDKLFENRYHPYTKALLSAVPIPIVGKKRKRVLLKGEISSPINPKPGCRFAPRCQYAEQKCYEVEPAFKQVSDGHFVACHFVDKINEL